MNSPLRIVYLEDDPADVRLVQDTFSDDGLCAEMTAVDNRQDFLAALGQTPDLILADYKLPTFDGMEALSLCRARCPEVPFIFLTGAMGDERAVETIKSGATDYVLKTRLFRLTVAVRRALAEAEDIARRKRAEEQLIAAKAAAESANRAKSQFLANISHELRTPMNAILGMIDMALPKATDPIVQDCLQTAKGSADLLLALLNDLLDSAKIESGKLELESAPFSLRRMLDQIARVLSARVSEKGLRFHCRIPKSVPDAVLGDRMRLQQVLLNLCGNAVKFTQRGEVEVSVRCRKQGCVACLEFAVRDTGIGIPPYDLEHLFQPFTQGDPSMARRFGGTGLGLSICKGLVEMMGGQIRVESEPGRGTTFSFEIRLPAAKEVGALWVAGGDVPAAVPSAARAALRILLVEDNAANQKVANYILQERGHTVEIAGDGNEAFCLTEQIRYDAILMDVQMPEMNGLEATAAIRAREYAGGENGQPRVPIIAMTAHAAQDDRDRCLAAGMDGYLCKPIQREELIATVERLADEGITDERLGIGGDCKFHISNPKSQIEDPAPPRFISHPSSLIPKPSSFTPASPFNLDRALARLGGKLGLFREMAGYFFSDAVKLLPEILAAAAAGDATAIGKRAHQLKGTLLYLGADAAVEAVTRVETISHSGNLADATVAIRSMENELTRLAAALRPYGPENDQKQIEMPDREEHNTPTHSSGAP